MVVYKGVGGSKPAKRVSRRARLSRYHRVNCEGDDLVVRVTEVVPLGVVK